MIKHNNYGFEVICDSTNKYKLEEHFHYLYRVDRHNYKELERLMKNDGWTIIYHTKFGEHYMKTSKHICPTCAKQINRKEK